MNIGGAQQSAVAELLTRVPAHTVLSHVVDALLAEDPTDSAGAVAFARAGALVGEVDRLRLAALTGIHDVDCRQLFTHADAGSTRGWLRRLPGGDQNQLARARQLAAHPQVAAAVGDASVSVRSAGAVCDALDSVPDDVDDEVVTALITFGVGSLLAEAGGSTPTDPADAALLAGCAANTTLGPAARMEPALVLLARRLTPNLLGRALGYLLDAITPQPEPDDGDGDAARYYLHVSVLPSGDWDVRGVLDAETGQLLTDALTRRQQTTTRDSPSPDSEPDTTEAPTTTDDGDAGSGHPAGGPPTDGDGAGGESARVLDFEVPAAAADTVDDTDPGACTHRPGGTHPDRPAPARRCPQCAPRRFVPAGRRRHDALTDLLRETTTRSARPGQALPTALTVTTTLAALGGEPGAPPGLLHHPGHPPTPLPTTTLQRLACNAALAAVILDAHRNPVGASHTARTATPRERRTLRALWGPHCATHGCAQTATVPHHVHPYTHSKETVLRDLVPLCHHCHLDIHEGKRTITLRNGRRINDTGWRDGATEAAA